MFPSDDDIDFFVGKVQRSNRNMAPNALNAIRDSCNKSKELLSKLAALSGTGAEPRERCERLEQPIIDNFIH